MNTLITANLLFILFFGMYLLVLKGTGVHQWNRWYLILSVFAAALIPQVELPQAQVVSTFNSPILLPTALIQSEMARAESWSWLDLLTIIYWLGASASLFWMVLALHRIWRLKRNASIDASGRYLVTDGDHAFSFFNDIQIGSAIPPELREMIFEHEIVHRQQGHSIDVLLFLVFRTFCWFNPFVYLAFRELRLTHEFIADEKVYHRFGTDYMHSLLNQVFGTSHFQLTNTFYQQSSIKQRIMKMNHRASSATGRYLYLLAIPLLAVSVWVTSCSNEPGSSETDQKSALQEMIKASPDDQVNDDVKSEVDNMPQFPGGTQGMMMHFKEGFVYPESLKEDNVEGKVDVQFVVHEDGSLHDVEAVKSDDERLEAPAIAFVQNMPNWEPGYDAGKPVKVKMVLPLQYTMK